MAGTGVAIATRGRSVKLEASDVLTFRLSERLRIEGGRLPKERRRRDHDDDGEFADSDDPGPCRYER